MSAKLKKLRHKLNDKSYRDAFVGAQISVGIPFQVRALRAQRGMDQKRLAELAGMLQPRISAIETPGESGLTLKTLRRLASAFDVALIVRFAPFSELIRFADDFSPDDFQVAEFAADMATMDGAPPSNGNVVDIFTGRQLEAVPSEDAKPARRVNTTSDLVQGTRQELRAEMSAETTIEYREVEHA